MIKARGSITLARVNDGAKGDTGAAGADGVSVADVTNFYKVSTASTGVTAPQSSGGRNLITGTSDEWKLVYKPAANVANSTVNYKTIKFDDPKVGDTYTLTCDIKLENFAPGSGGTFRILTQGSVNDVWSGGNYTTNIFAFNFFSSTSNGTFHCTKTVKIASTVGKKYNFGFRCDYSDGNGSVYIKNFKLEKGSTATPWTPAPEDSGWSTTVPTLTAMNKYLWNYEHITGSDDSTIAITEPRVIGVYGDKGNTGATGPQGPTGPAGKDAILIQSSAPSSPKVGQLWQTASGEPIKRWDGSKWVLYYVSVENLDVDTLSAITANLGTVTAGVLKSKDDVTKFDVANGVLESFDNETLQTLRLSAGGIKYIGKDASTNQMVSYLTFRGLVVRNINNRYGCSITLDESFDDFTVTKLINNGQGTDTVPLFSSLKQVPVPGTKVLSLTKGTNYVKLFTAAEVAALLGTSSGNADHAMISVANGDAKAFNARVFGAEYWSDSDAWWVYFNSAASITQPVRINYMITRIDQ